MKVLHLVKTTHGASWALQQAKVLLQKGVEVHVLLPDNQGPFYSSWEKSGTKIHILNFDIPIKSPWKYPGLKSHFLKIIERIKPNLIHSHFFGTSMMMRSALQGLAIPKVFQVPGPLHLESPFFKLWDISFSDSQDYWICSSKYIKKIYKKNGIADNKLFLSYYGNDYSQFLPGRSENLRLRMNIPKDSFVVGNLNYMYAPKLYLGQTYGIKGHEDLIKACQYCFKENTDIHALIMGCAWNNKIKYEKKLQLLASSNSSQIHFTGRIAGTEANKALQNLDLLIHIPYSENCGGVLEAMLLEVPVLATPTGGIPELVFEKQTGSLLESRSPLDITNKILEIKSNYDFYKKCAQKGRELASIMFDINRTASEVFEIYQHILDKSKTAPQVFDPQKFLKS
ncbi:MAG: glycosyltransferase family 4 protein [Halobacteriovoraceae bacterium]|nr:glycosyltransferase family 4 protein [Halobacteriovoraceae bacterium]